MQKHRMLETARHDSRGHHTLASPDPKEKQKYLLLDLDIMADYWWEHQRECPRDAILHIGDRQYLIVGTIRPRSAPSMLRVEQAVAASRRWLSLHGDAAEDWLLDAPDPAPAILTVPESAIVTDPAFYATDSPHGAFVIADLARIAWDDPVQALFKGCPWISRTADNSDDMRGVIVGWHDQHGVRRMYTVDEALARTRSFCASPNLNVYLFPGGITLRGWQMVEKEGQRIDGPNRLFARRSQIHPDHPAARYLRDAWFAGRDGIGLALVGINDRRLVRVRLFAPETWAQVNKDWRGHYGVPASEKRKVTA